MPHLRPKVRSGLLFAAVLMVAAAYTLTTAQSVVVPQHDPITAANVSMLKELAIIDHSVSVVPKADTATATPVPYVSPTERFKEHIEFSPDGHYLAHFMDKVLWLTDLQTGSQRALLLGGLHVPGFSPDWKTLAAVETVSNYTSVIRLWDMAGLLPAADTSAATGTACTITVTSSSINLRGGPSAKFPALGYAYRDESLPILAVGATTGWVQVRAKVGLAWVDTHAGKMMGDCASLPLLLSSSQARTTIKSNGYVQDYRFTPDSQRIMIDNYYSLEFWSAQSGRVSYSINAHRKNNNNSNQTDIAHSLIFSADGHYLADNDGFVWDVATGKSVVDMQAVYPNAFVNAAAFSPDSQLLATAGQDGTVRVWDIATAEQKSLFYTDQTPVLSVTFSPNGRWLAALSALTNWTEYNTQVWDLTANQEVLSLDKTTAAVFSPDSTTILRSGRDPQTDNSFYPTIQTVNIETKAEGQVSRASLDYAQGYNADGTLLLTSYSIVNVKGGEEYLAAAGELAVNADWSLAARVNDDSKIIVYGIPKGAAPVIASDTPTPSLTPRPIWTGLPAGVDATATITPTPLPPYPTRTQMPQQPVTLTPSFTPQPVGTASLPPTVSVLPGTVPITAETLSQIKLLTTYSRQRGSNTGAFMNPGTFFSRDGSLLFTIQDTTVTIYDAVSGVARTTINVPVTVDKYHSAAVSAAFAPDGKTLATVSSDKTVRFWDVTTGVQTSTFTVEMPDAKSYFGLSQPQYSPDGQQLMVGLLNGDYLIVEAKSGAVITQIDDDNYGQFGFLPDGTPVTLGRSGFLSGDRQVIPFNLKYDVWDNGYTNQQGVPNADWSMLAVYAAGSVQLDLWNTVSAKQRATLRAHTTNIVNAVFSGDGHVLASLDSGNVVVLWDVLTGDKIQTLTLPAAPTASTPAYRITLSHDGSVLMVNDESGLIHLWDTKTSSEVASVAAVGTAYGQNSLFLSPDGSTLVSVTGQWVTMYGIPSEGRPAYAAVPVIIKPVIINVREKPSLDSTVMTRAKGGDVLATGRDAAGRFIYLDTYGGWVNAGSTYIDPGTFDLSQLPIRAS